MASMQCPNCNVDDSKVDRTWAVRFSDVEMRLRLHYCKACGVQFRSYEFTFDDKTSIEKISKTLDSALNFYPPIIRPYRWKQTELFPKK